MRRFILPALLLIAAGIPLCAQVTLPPFMSYQAYMTDTSGRQIPDGFYALTFSLYLVDSGGVPIWNESHPAVPVAKGLCNVILGKGLPERPLDLRFDLPYYLGIRIGNDPEMRPRVPMTTVAYSFRSRWADNVARGAIDDSSVAVNAGISVTKLDGSVLTENEIVAGTGITISRAGGLVTISANPALLQLNGDVNGPLTGNTIAANAVTAPKIAAGAVTTAKIDDQAVTGLKLADNAVTTAKLADNAATTLKIADNAVTAAKIQPDIISSIDDVSSDAGNIDLVAGSNITITPNAAAKTITFASTAPGLTLPYNGTVASGSTAFDAENTGAGKAGYFHVTNAASAVEAMSVATTSNNAAGDALNASAQSGTALDASSTGTEPTIRANNTNASGTAPVIRGYSGAASVFTVNQAGDVTAAGDVSANTCNASVNIGTAGNPLIGRYYKDNAVYAWAHINQGGVMLSGFGCTSARIGVGMYLITYKLNFNPNEYAPMAIVQHPVGVVVATINASAGNSCTVALWAWTGANFQAYDAEFFFHLTGRQ